jgi:hypothetical protein
MYNLVDSATLAVGLWEFKFSLSKVSKIALCAEEVVVGWDGSRSLRGQTILYPVLNTSSTSSI